jgi:tellurite resistance protein TehA-like permease
MTVTLLLNIFFALGIVVALAVVCRIPYRLVSVERLEERAAPATTAAPA